MGYIATGATSLRKRKTAAAAVPLAKTVAKVAQIIAAPPMLSSPARGSSLATTTSVAKVAPPSLLAPVAPTRTRTPVIPGPVLGPRRVPPSRPSSPLPGPARELPDRSKQGPSSPAPSPSMSSGAVVEVPVATTSSSTTSSGGGGGGGSAWSGGGGSAFIDDLDFELPEVEAVEVVPSGISLKTIGMVAGAVGLAYIAWKKWG